MRTHDYIQAACSLLSDGKEFDDVIKKLKAVLEEKGHEKLYRSILIGLQKKAERAANEHVAEVKVAREKDSESLKEQIDASIKELDAQEIATSVDETLIGGYVIEHDNKVIDKSYKTRLVALYRSLIN